MSIPLQTIRRWARRLEKWWRPDAGLTDNPSLPLGKRGERLAVEFLRDLGYVIVAEGARDRWSEVDIIAVDGRTVVFVEVKSRNGTRDNPLEAVDFTKQKRLTRAALAYLKRHRLLKHSARFDVVGITWADPTATPKLRHVRNAFEPTGKWQMFS